MCPDLGNTTLQRRRHGLMHAVVIRSFDEVRVPTIPAQQIFQFLVGDPGQQGGVVDLVSVEVKDRKYSPVANRIQKFADVPRGRQRTSFGFAVAHHGRNDQVGVIERGSAGVREHVPQFTSLVNGSWGLRRAVTANAAGERELFKEVPQAFFVLAFLWIDLAVGALEIDWCQNSRRAMTRTREKDHLGIMVSDDSTQVRIDERKPGA